MNIKSLGIRTDLIFSKFSGFIEEHEGYVLIKTPSNPSLHWGNFIVFDHPPKKGDLKKWKELFDQEFSYYREPHHYSFIWDSNNHDEKSSEEFIQDGFELESSVVLTAESLNKPRFFNNEVKIKKVTTPSEWQQAINLQIKCADPKYLNSYYEEFKKNQFLQYKKTVECNKGY